MFPFSLFARAHAQLNLTPAERAFLKLLEGFLWAGVVAALPAVASLLNAGVVDWPTVGRTAIASFGFAFLMAASKYFKAHGDVPLADAVSVVANSYAARMKALNAGQPSDVKTPGTAPAPAA